MPAYSYIFPCPFGAPKERKTRQKRTFLIFFPSYA